MFKKGYTPWNKNKKGWCPSSGFKKDQAPWNKGKTLSIEHRSKLKEARKNFKHSELTKARMRIIAKERGYGKWMIGKNIPIEARRKVGLKEKGSLHWNWKGGITPLKKTIRESLEYELWQNEIFKRDDYTCRECGIKGGVLNAHHTKQFAIIFHEFLKEYNQFSPIEDIETLSRLAIYYQPFWDLTNGKTLCVDCHKLTRFGQVKVRFEF